MLKPILLTAFAVLAVAVVVALVVASRRPDSFRYERALKVNAAPEEVYSHIVDFRQWPKWSPFENRDTHLERRYSGPDTGAGATYAWEGKKTGVGSMTITRVTPAREVLIDLNFKKPFPADHRAEFTLTPDGSSRATSTPVSQTSNASANKRPEPMLYSIFCYDNEAVTSHWSREEDDAAMARIAVVQQKLVAQKRLGPAVRLHPTTTATTIRKAESVVMDGPFAETKEQLLGFYIVEVEGKEDAIEIARELAVAHGTQGSFELRPLVYFNGRGAPDSL